MSQKAKKGKTMVQISEISKEEFERYKGIITVEMPGIGRSIAKSELKKYIPESASAFRKLRMQPESDSVHLSQEEAEKVGIKISGNPKLGVRLYNEQGCKVIAPYMGRDYLVMLCCAFHREEIIARLYPAPAKAEAKTLETDGANNYSRDTKIDDNRREIVLLEGLLESHQKTEAALTRIADLFEKYLAIQSCAPCNVPQKEEGVKGSDPENEKNGGISGPLLSVSEVPDSTPSLSGSEKFQDLKSIHESGSTVPLKLKRSNNDPIYRRDEKSYKDYCKRTLQGVREDDWNLALKLGYDRMRDVYGVPVDTYKKEFFEDTGKRAKSSLEVAYWLEFRNPALKGLLRACIETEMDAMPPVQNDC